MYKKLIGFLTVLFLAFTINAGADDTLYEVGHTYAGACVVDVLGSLGLNSEDPVIMTPIYQKNCNVGYYNDTLDSCAVVGQRCDPGFYLDLSTGTPKCEPCEADFWCPLTYMSVETPNVSVCGADYVDDDAFDEDNKPNGTIGRCKCPAGTTAAANENMTVVKATDISQCSYYKLNPGQQLARTENDTGDYIYSIETCDEDHYCVGGIFRSSDYNKTIKACPTKFTGITTESKCNEFKQKMGVAANDIVWNPDADDNHKCIIKGHADVDAENGIGSFRCSYTCPAGYFMRVTGGQTSGGWVNFYSTCEKCPVGNWCPGGTFFLDETYNDTLYHSDTYASEKNKYIDYNERYGIKDCPEGTATVESGAESAAKCTAYCPAGKYYNVSTGHCESCTDAGDTNIGNLSYCPGGTSAAYNSETDENVGIFECPQYNIVDYDNTPVYSWQQEHDADTISLPNADRTGCVCPRGYEWNNKTLACCSPNKACCGPGYKLRSYADGTYECLLCENENTEESACVCPRGYEWNESTSDCINDDMERVSCSCPNGYTWGMTTDESNNPVLKCVYNDVFCSGITVKKLCEVPRDPVTDNVIGYRNGTQCPVCVDGSEPVYNQQSQEYTSCSCTPDLMKNYPDLYPEQPLAGVRQWNGSNSCVFTDFSVSLYYTNIDLSGYYRTHGNGYYYSPYWSKTYNYETSKFNINHSPAETGYVFNSTQGFETETGTGYVFAGWCRETSFCCPIGYRVQDLEGGKKECRYCDGDETGVCSGSAYTAPGTPVEIDPKDAADRGHFTYYAMLVYTLTCDAGKYLSGSSCAPCPAGYWCPGGAVSPSRPGKNACEPGTYNEFTNKSEKTDCISCKTLSPVSDNGLTTQNSASTSVGQCGYYCSAGYYDANDNRFKCDNVCTAGNYCPGGGISSSGWVRAFYPYTEHGKGKEPCPSGLTSDAGAKNCYMSHCDAKEYVKYENGTYICAPCEQHVGCISGAEECFNENDQSISGITTETNCKILGYTWDNENNSCLDKDNHNILNITTGTQCTELGYKWANNKGCSTYYYCPGGDKISVGLIPWYNINHTTGATKLLTCPGGKMAHPAAADHCYDLPNAGYYTTDNDTMDWCPAGKYCPSADSGTQDCPAGSVSPAGATWIHQCQCLSGDNYQPDGVYAEKGAELVFDERTENYVCVNTYLALDNADNFEAATPEDDTTPDANARIVSCKWVSNPNGNQQVEGIYKDCTTKALSVCHASSWNPGITATENNTVTHLYLEKLAEEFGNNQTVQTLMNNMTAVQNIKNITQFVGSDVCPVQNPDDVAYHIFYLGVENADFDNQGIDMYTSALLPLNVLNPIQENYGFDGWCKYTSQDDAEEYKDTCTTICTEELDNNCIVEKQNNRNAILVLDVGTTGDKWIYAKWTPTPYTITYDTNGGTCADNACDSATYTIESDDITLPTADKLSMDGYVFAGWYDNAELNGEPVTVIEQGSTGDKTFYAKWDAVDYTITYKKPDVYAVATGYWSDYAGLTPATYNINSGNVVLPVTPEERTGYTFGGWYTSCTTDGFVSDCTAGVNVESFHATDIENKTFYSKWTANTYHVTYKCLPTDEVLALTDDRIYNNQYFDGLFREYSVVCPNNGYTATKWTCTYGDITEDITPDTNPAAPEDAIWTIPYDVDCVPTDATPNVYNVVYKTIKVDGEWTEDNTLTPNTYTVESNAEQRTLPADLSRVGYDFNGWCDGAETCETMVTKIADDSIGNKTFYAQWTATPYTITYDTNGGTCADNACDDATYTIESDNITLPTSEQITRENYRFDGWCLDDESNTDCQLNNIVQTETDSETGEEISILTRIVASGTTGDLNFTAQWLSMNCPVGYGHRDEEDEISDPTDLSKCYARVVFNANGGTPEPGIIKKYYNNQDKYTLAAEEIPEVAQEGYEFDYWYDSDNNSVSIETEFVGDNTLTAHWTPHTYTIVFDKNGADGSQTMDDQSMTYGESANLSDNVYTNTGYSFAAWCKGGFDSTTGACTGDTYADKASITVNNDITLYAMWAPVCTTNKRLRVGDNSMCMYTTQYTHPALAIRVGEQTYYGNMTPAAANTKMSSSSTGKLHIRYNDTLYNVHDLTATIAE